MQMKLNSFIELLVKKTMINIVITTVNIHLDLENLKKFKFIADNCWKVSIIKVFLIIDKIIFRFVQLFANAKYLLNHGSLTH